jgi:hypothetical protein
MKGVLPWLIRWACQVDGTRDFRSALAVLVGPVQKKIFSPHTISIPFSPSPSNLGRQSCRIAGLLEDIFDNKHVLLKVTESGPPFRTAEMGATLLVSGIFIFLRIKN